MDYLNIYNQLVTFRKKHPSEEEYTETHHIVPLCMGGDNSKDNLVVLSAREHFLAHHLLYKHYRLPRLAHAWFAMLRGTKSQYRDFTSRQYSAAKKAHSEAMKKRMNENHPFLGKKHTKEAREKISKANKGRVKSPEEIANWVDKVAKRPRTEEWKSNIGVKGMVMLKNIHNGEVIRIFEENIKDLQNPSEWTHPQKGIPKQTCKCKYCDFEGSLMMVSKYHDEKCKFKDTGVYIDSSKIRKTKRRQISVFIDGVKYNSVNEAHIKTGIDKKEINEKYVRSQE